MNRMKIVFGIVFACICIILHSQTLASNEMGFDIEYQDYSYSFKPLTINEHLSYQYEKNTLYVFKVNENNKNEIVNSWANVSYGDYQISKNRKKMVFSINKAGYYKPTFFVNGEKGLVTYLFNAPIGYRTDNNVEWIIGIDWQAEPKKEREYNKIEKYKALVYSIDEIKIIGGFEWSLSSKFGSLDFYRTSDRAFDFRIIYDSESLMYAEAYYNVKSGNLKINFDLTSDYPEKPLDYFVTSEENGYLSNDEN